MVDIETPRGPGRAAYFLAEVPAGVLILSHGAGKGVDTGDLQALAAQLPDRGWSVVLFDQPWVVAGRKVATPPPHLDDGLRAAVEFVRREPWCAPDLPLVAGGRSAGARSAARCAAGDSAAGCLALAFPLHPPGRPESSRLAELEGAGVPTLILQGEKDAFGGPDEFPDVLPEAHQLSVVPDADHSFRVSKRAELDQEAIWNLIAATAAHWLTTLG